MTVETIEGVARDVTPQSTAMTVAQPQSAVQAFDAPNRDPLRAMGLMDAAEFQREMEVIKAGRDRMLQLQANLLRGPKYDKAGKKIADGTDYDTIPGTNKPSLYQPGAEQLAMFHRLIPEHRQTLSITPHNDPAWPEEVRVDTQTFLHLGSLEGPIVGSAVASCSSYEDRYLYRNTERVCPKCGKPAIYRSKPEWAPRSGGPGSSPLPGYEQGGWKCGSKKGGCGANFPDNEPSLANAGVGKAFVENPRGLINTITQMSAKRGFVGAIRHTLGITDLFTQDVEDQRPQDDRGGPEDLPPPPDTAPSAPAAPRPAQAATQPRKKGTDAVFEGPVIKEPEGLRSTPNGKVAAFAIKVGNSKHNVDVFEPLAGTILPLLKEGVVVGVDGTREERDWPGRGDKPMMKVIIDVRRVVIDGQEYLQGAPPMPAEAPSAPMFPATVGMGDPSDGDGPLPFDPDEPAVPQRTQITDPAAGAAQGAADVFGVLANVTAMTSPQGRPYFQLEVEPTPETFVKVAVLKDAAVENGLTDDMGDFLYPIGQRVRVMGGWNRTGTIIGSEIVTPA
jgi:hypothetical protein